MGKLEFLDALKRSMIGLPPETQARTLAYYEQRFVDGVAAGRSEDDVSRELDDPKKIAMTLRASAHLDALKQTRNPLNLVRLLVTAVGLAIFNLFMVVPAAVFAALLAAVYACALAFYVAGIAITASGLSGANELNLNVPLRHMAVHDGSPAAAVQTRVSIGETGIQVYQDKAPKANDGSDEQSRVLREAGSVAGRSIRISNEMDGGSRTTQAFFGLGMVLGGIILFLLSLVVTRFTFIGIKRYFQMNLSLLKGS